MSTCSYLAASYYILDILSLMFLTAIFLRGGAICTCPWRLLACDEVPKHESLPGNDHPFLRQLMFGVFPRVTSRRR